MKRFQTINLSAHISQNGTFAFHIYPFNFLSCAVRCLLRQNLLKCCANSRSMSECKGKVIARAEVSSNENCRDVL